MRTNNNKNDEHKRHSMTPMRLLNCSQGTPSSADQPLKIWSAFEKFYKIKKSSLTSVLEFEESNWEFLRSSMLSGIVFAPTLAYPKVLGASSVWCRVHDVVVEWIIDLFGHHPWDTQFNKNNRKIWLREHRRRRKTVREKFSCRFPSSFF